MLLFWRWSMRRLSEYWGIAMMIAGWQLAILWSHVNAIVVPSPLSVATTLIDAPWVYLRTGCQTLVLSLLGLTVGMALGTLMAASASMSRALRGMLVPVALILSSIPVVALIPILMRLFGHGETTILAIVTVISFLPTFVLTLAGFQNLPLGSSDLLTVIGASRHARFIYLHLPAAVPHWMIALRLTAPLAVMSAMTAEYLMGTSGLGYEFRTASTRFGEAEAFAYCVVASLLSVGVFLITNWAERYVLERWR